MLADFSEILSLHPVLTYLDYGNYICRGFFPLTRVHLKVFELILLRLRIDKFRSLSHSVDTPEISGRVEIGIRN